MASKWLVRAEQAGMSLGSVIAGAMPTSPVHAGRTTVATNLAGVQKRNAIERFTVISVPLVDEPTPVGGIDRNCVHVLRWQIRTIPPSTETAVTPIATRRRRAIARSGAVGLSNEASIAINRHHTGSSESPDRLEAHVRMDSLVPQQLPRGCRSNAAQGCGPIENQCDPGFRPQCLTCIHQGV